MRRSGRAPFGPPPGQPVRVRGVRLLELIGKAFAALWVAWLVAAVVAFLAYASGLLSPVAALAVGLTLAVVFMAIGLLTKEGAAQQGLHASLQRRAPRLPSGAAGPRR